MENNCKLTPEQISRINATLSRIRGALGGSVDLFNYAPAQSFNGQTFDDNLFSDEVINDKEK